jgi:hypothetical protein
VSDDQHERPLEFWDVSELIEERDRLEDGLEDGIIEDTEEARRRMDELTEAIRERARGDHPFGG